MGDDCHAYIENRGVANGKLAEVKKSEVAGVQELQNGSAALDLPIVIHPLPCEEEFNSASNPFTATVSSPWNELDC